MVQKSGATKKGMFMDSVLTEAIEKDLFNELRWLVCSATEWDACDKLIGEPPRIPKIQEPCLHLKVYAMDSTFLHARSLYEFFTATEESITRNEKRGSTRLTWRDYSLTARQTSNKYDQFMKPLHGRVMHLEKDRSGHDEIKNEVVNFAVDILRLWNGFSQNPSVKPYESLLNKFRVRAIEDAASVAKQYKRYGFECPFSSAISAVGRT
jgi:hypothetical protein